MSTVICIANKAQELFDKVRTSIDFIGPLLLRIYIVPVFWMASNNKWNPFDGDSSLDSVIQWFGNPEWGLGLPFPALMAYLAWGTEYFGAILLALGLATRWISIPLMATMIVAAVTVHWGNGWQAVHDLASPYASANAGEAIERLSHAKDILKEHGNYDWLTEHGNFIISNNGIEWAVTYFIILFALFVTGGGKFFSVDYWIAKKFRS
ncbi:MAG: DoxX family protein [Proteobacteria bacterium]|nr:DoxX family protein [Pseudomonadota bacterium]